MKTSRQGFTVVEVLMVVVVVAIIGLLGWTAYNSFSSNDEADQQSQVAPTYNQASDLPEPPEIKDTTSLDEASALLDSVELEKNDGELAELDAELNKF